MRLSSHTGRAITGTGTRSGTRSGTRTGTRTGTLAEAEGDPKPPALTFFPPSKAMDQSFLPPCCDFCVEKYFPQWNFQHFVGIVEVSEAKKRVVPTWGHVVSWC